MSAVPDTSAHWVPIWDVADDPAAKVDIHTYQAPTTLLVESRISPTDGNATLSIRSDGLIQWGVGGSTPADVSVQRTTSPISLLVSPDLQVLGSVNAMFNSGSGGVGAISAFVAKSLSTSGTAYLIRGKGTSDANYRISLRSIGDIEWGPGNTAADTNLYRSAAGSLKTDGSILAANIVQARAGTSSQISLEDNGSGAATIWWGTPAFTDYLYHPSAGVLTTNCTFNAGIISANNGAANQILLNYDGKIYFSNLADTNLYRDGVNSLKTDGDVHVVKSLATNLGAAGQMLMTTVSGNAGLYFGSANDTNLYRYGTAGGYGVLITDGLLRIMGAGAGIAANNVSGLLLNFQGLAPHWVECGAADSGGAGFRMLRISN